MTANVEIRSGSDADLDALVAAMGQRDHFTDRLAPAGRPRGVVTVLVRPIAREGPQLLDRAPAYVAQVEAGKGPVGHLLKRYRLADYLARNQARLREAGSGLATPALAVVRSVFATIVGLVTIVVLTFLMVVEGPTLVTGWLAVLPTTDRNASGGSPPTAPRRWWAI